MLTRSTFLSAVALLGACGESASKSNPPAPTPVVTAEQQAQPKPTAPEPDFSGEVTGIVKLAVGAQLPLATLEEGAQLKPIAATGCPPITEADRQTVIQSAATGGLAPIHLAVTQMSAAPKREPKTHEVTILENCRLSPPMIGVLRGDKLRVTNQSPAPLLPRLPGDPFLQAMLQGASREVTLSSLGPMALHCDFAGFCGQTLILAAGHTLYAVTDAEGRFKISGIPLGEQLVIHAWHPLFEVTSAPFTLTKAERSKTLELELKPLAPAPAAAPAEPAPSAPAKTRSAQSKTKARPESAR